MPARQGGAKRIFDKAFDDAMRSTSAPGSASADYEPSDADYRGNRKTKQRYAYSEDSRAAFIELSPPNMTVNEFKTRLENTRGVVGVRLHPKGTKTQQNNVGKHYQEHNFMVNSHVHPGKDMEFELSTHNQLNDGTRPKTVTALFKQTSQVVFLEAYRILVEACKGKELLPDMIVNQHQEARERYRDCSVELSGADGSQALPAPIDEPVIIDASEDDMSGAEESQALPASSDAPMPSSEQPGLCLTRVCQPTPDCQLDSPGSGSSTRRRQTSAELQEEYSRLRLNEVRTRLDKFREDQERESAEVDWTSDPHEDLQEGSDSMLQRLNAVQRMVRIPTVQRLNAVETKQQGTNAALQAQIDTLKLRNAKLESSLVRLLACGAVLAVLAVLATVKRQ